MTDREYQGLVELLDAQFARIDTRFDQVDARLDQVDARLDQVDARFGQVDARFDQVDARLDQVDRQFTEVERRFDAMDGRIDGLARRQDEGLREILGHFDELYRRLERLEAEYFAIVQALRRIETLVGSEQAQRQALGQSVDQLRRQIADLQARLDAVESRLQD